MGYLKSGDCVIVWGQLSKDAAFREFESGAMVTSFSVKYGVEDKLYGDSGAKKGKFMDVKVWGRDFDRALCDFCACLEKGDRILAAGELRLDRKQDRDGNDRWYLSAEHVSIQQTVQTEDVEDYAEEEPESEPEEAPPALAEEDYPEVLR